MSSWVDEGGRESLQSCLAAACVRSINSHGEPPDWGLGKGLGVPHPNRAICYEISDLGDLSGVEIFWGVTLWRSANSYWRFGAFYWFYFRYQAGSWSKIDVFSKRRLVVFSRQGVTSQKYSVCYEMTQGVAHILETICAIEIYSGLDGRIILKWILCRIWKCKMNSSASLLGPMVGCD